MLGHGRLSPSWPTRFAELTELSANPTSAKAAAFLSHLLRISLLSRCTAMLAGLRTLIQTRHGPDRYRLSIFFDTTHGERPARTVPCTPDC
jgi:hypothetical protein